MALAFLLRGSIPAGWFLAPTSKPYLNWLLIQQWLCWAMFALYAVVFVLFIVEGVKAPYFTAGDKRMDPLRSMHLLRSSWSGRVCLWAIQLPSTLFVGVVMGRWSLFVPMLLADMFGKAVVFTGALAWEAIPEAVRNPTPEAKAKDDADIKAVSTDPITGALEEARQRAADEKKAQEEMADKMIEEWNLLS